MAKVKKPTKAKAATKVKKTATKKNAKPAAKANKTTVKKAVKKTTAKKAAPAKKKVAEPKKAAPKKVAGKVKAATEKPEMKSAMRKGTPSKPVKVESINPLPAKKSEDIVKPTPPLSQLNMFQMPNQRPIAHKPAKSVTEDRSRYSDDELKEFEKLILEKLEKAREEYKILKETLNRNNDEGTDSTSGGNTKVLEDGAETAEKENLSQLAARQQKYITNLENALVRIKNGTYGICSVTGKLISKDRLIAVPHTTQSIEAKMMKQD